MLVTTKQWNKITTVSTVIFKCRLLIIDYYLDTHPKGNVKFGQWLEGSTQEYEVCLHNRILQMICQITDFGSPLHLLMAVKLRL